MLETKIYFIVLIVLTCITFIKKVNIIGKILLVLYTSVAGFAVYVVSNGIINYNNVTILPYVFLIVSYILFFSPFLKNDNLFSVKKVVTEIDDRYIFFIYIYWISSILYLINFAPQVSALMNSRQWLMNYNTQVLGEVGTAFVYNNWFMWFASQLAGYTSLLAIILSFLFLRDKKHIKLAYLTIALYIITKFCSSSYVSSRGMLYQVAFTLIGLYLFILPDMKRSAKATIAILSVFAAIMIIPYIIDVTVSRFTAIGAFDSVLRYLGQSPVVFNYGVAPIKRLSWGKYTLGTLFGDSTINQSAVGGRWGTSFYTFVGWLYIDWGPIGVLICGAILKTIIDRFIRKQEYQISDLIIIFYYYNFLTLGVLVIGPAQIISILMNIVLYFVCKYFFEGNVRFRIKMKG